MKSLAAIALLLPCLAVPYAASAQIRHRVEHVANPNLLELPVAGSVAQADERVLQLQLDGESRRLLLAPDRAFEHAAARHVPALAHGRLRLYRGTVAGKRDHWVRLHLWDGRWEGIIASDTHTWVLSGARTQAYATRGVGAAGDAHIVYRQDALHGDIDLRHDNHALPSPVWRSHTAGAAKGSALPYTLGVSLVLDTEFQQLAPDPAASAVAILHLVAGYYERTAATAVYLTDLKLLPPGNAGIVGSGDLLDELAAYLETPGAPAFHAATHLLTGKPDVGGGAALGTSLCSRESAIGYASWHGIPMTAAILAHEIGHNYGAGHDAETGIDAACPVSGFLMAPSFEADALPSDFSPCSIAQFEHYRAYTFTCLGDGLPTVFRDGFED